MSRTGERRERASFGHDRERRRDEPEGESGARGGGGGSFYATEPEGEGGRCVALGVGTCWEGRRAKSAASIPFPRRNVSCGAPLFGVGIQWTVLDALLLGTLFPPLRFPPLRRVPALSLANWGNVNAAP